MPFFSASWPVGGHRGKGSHWRGRGRRWEVNEGRGPHLLPAGALKVRTRGNICHGCGLLFTLARTRGVRLLRSNYVLECSKEWGDGFFKRAGLYIEPHLCMMQNQWSVNQLDLFRGVSLWWFSLEKKFVRLVIMGGEPVTTEPSFIESWKDGRVVVSGTEITVNEALIADVSGLPNEGEVVSRDEMNQVSQLTKFIKDDETFCWLDSGIARESLPKPWDRVAVQVMKYLTLEGKFRKLFGYHITILNSMRNKEKINIPLFLFKSLEKSMHAIKAESSEEDRKSEDPESLGGRSNPPKVTTTTPSVKSAKSPIDSLSLSVRGASMSSSGGAEKYERDEGN
eukprot:Gb_11572 [translate_table: standard]